MNSNLISKKCIPCEGGTPPFSEGEINNYLEQVDESHHPDIRILYNRVQIEIWPHAANGLTENDFILAAKIDVL
ncbi:MAG: 4a-hydroxytetrahydrobiopterin dehydratase [Candidatus Colwellbacteria bacterium]|nr:4a-hydroxytetrahydrobiopterin dehydratase [Candidatus Colwellbacteria bacterium]